MHKKEREKDPSFPLSLPSTLFGPFLFAMYHRSTLFPYFPVSRLSRRRVSSRPITHSWPLSPPPNNILAYSQTNHISAWEGEREEGRRAGAQRARSFGAKRGEMGKQQRSSHSLSFSSSSSSSSSSNCQNEYPSLSLLCKLMTALGQWQRQNLSPFDR